MAKMRVLSVHDVQIQIDKSDPPQLSVLAAGAVGTPGWSGPELKPLEKKLSADGILDLDFVAEPPTGPVIQRVTPISAHVVWTGDVDRLVGVKVYSRTNEITRLLSEGGPDQQTTQAVGEEMMPAAFAGAGLPTTLALGEEGPGPTTLALGEEGPGPTTLALGEEGSPASTRALGEEGPLPTTAPLGEEHPFPTTLAPVVTEEGPWPNVAFPWPTTLALFEEGPGPKAVVGETNPASDDPKGPFGETMNQQWLLGFRNPFGSR